MLNCPFYAGLDESFQTNSFRRADTAQTVTDSESINDNHNNNSLHTIHLSVFPNPSENTFTFILKGLNENNNITLKVEDITGRTVYETEQRSEENDIKITWNPLIVDKGIYIYKLGIVNKKVFTGKLLKM
jgi:hypothetical protein